MAARKGEMTIQSRGIAFFLGYEPWQTCWRFPSGSVRYFDAAERQGLISNPEAKALSQALIALGPAISKNYDGRFAPYFDEPRVTNILGNLDELHHLSESGLAIADAWVDRLFEACPTPLIPRRHFVVNSFRNVVTAGEIDFYSENPWLAWTESLDLTCLGPWIGLKAGDILQMLDALHERAINRVRRSTGVADDVLGHKVTIPIFSRGLQGFVSGAFYDVPKAQREPILTTLLQFGETMGDVYANLRKRHFLDSLDEDLSDEQLARQFVNMASPIQKLILQRNGQRSGYKLKYEKSYFAGYDRLTNDELDVELSPDSFYVDAPYNARIFIEPIPDLPNLNPEFTRTQLESLLHHTLGSFTSTSNGAQLAYSDAQALLAEYEVVAQSGASVAKHRQHFAVIKVHKSWEKGQVNVSNAELKGYLEDKLGREVSSGYQATSYVSEFEKIFDGKVSVTKTRSAISMSWSKKV
jgi:hypothetical protein